MTKSSQKRARSEEDSEETFPQTKRRGCFCNGNGTDQADGGTLSHQSQAASTSASPLQGHCANSTSFPVSTSPLAGSTASQCLPLISTDPATTLHRTRLGRDQRHPQHRHCDQLQTRPPALPHADRHHHLDLQALRGKGEAPPVDSGHSPLCALPEVVHKTSEEYYAHINRLLRSAHFEKLKRMNEPSHVDSTGGSGFE